MTLHWWMHWFWITCVLTISIWLTHSMAVSSVATVPVPVPTDMKVAGNRPIRRPMTGSVRMVTEAPNRNHSRLTVIVNDTEQLDQQNSTVSGAATEADLNYTVTADKTDVTSIGGTTVPPPGLRSEVPATATLTAASITGISFGVLMFGALVAVTSFILYRRRYLNKPQTLNDKCSNPDSSGYIDDSTIRENSEEMYSLDNDSFLNSLEAMTIQNYWTDSVKHTKL